MAGVDHFPGRFVPASDQHIAAAVLQQRHGAGFQRIGFRRQPARFDAVGGQDRDQRQQQGSQGIEQFGIGQFGPTARRQDRVEHHRNIGIGSQQRVQRAGVLGAADEADLDCRHRHVVQYGPRLSQ